MDMWLRDSVSTTFSFVEVSYILPSICFAYFHNDVTVLRHSELASPQILLQCVRHQLTVLEDSHPANQRLQHHVSAYIQKCWENPREAAALD